MRILMITNHYLDGRGGGTVGSRGFINAFASIYSDCLLIYPDNGNDISKIIPPGLKTIGCRDNRPKWLKAAEIYFGKLHRFASLAKRTIKDYNPDIIVFDTSTVSSGIIRFARRAMIRTITIHHNVERDYFRDNPPPFLIRFPFLFFIRRTEKDAVNLSDLNLTHTESDSKTLTEYYSGKNCPKIKCIGVLGTETAMDAQICFKNKTVIHSKKIFVMSGSLSYRQSDLSFIGFIENYLPILEGSCKNVELVIAGSNPSERLVRVCNQNASIHLIKNPLDLQEIMDGSDVYICPVDRGSGLKIRMMDGLKAGIPVLAHGVSARGYEYFVETGAIHTYYSVSTFTESLNEILSTDSDRNERIAQYRNYFSLESGMARLKSIIDSDF